MAFNYYQEIYKRVSQRSPESTVSIWGINHKPLRKHLVETLSETGSHQGLLADPVFESVYSWTPADQTMSSLSGNLLLPSLVNAMDRAKGHEFKKEWYPFKHQLKAWNCLLTDKKSVVVTSGTGSGKTECFMVPILNDLAKEVEDSKEGLEGVRALFLYPLNALINSQRDRLRAWTSDYKHKVRFCLYNGNTPNVRTENPKDVGANPNQVFTRKVLRSSPPPILVTNATMLEYMLVRNIDSPILEKSQGKLRWIVLDEAHTYVGSQAAELSLLLRRVMIAFGVSPKDVRFVATSATIGGDADAELKLQKFLASLAGISEEQVIVIGGSRQVPVLPKNTLENISIEDLKKIDAEKNESDVRYSALIKHPTALKLRELLNPEKKSKSLKWLAEKLFGDEEKTDLTLEWIDLCSSTSSKDNTPFLPLRGHFFHQVVNGLWACSDKNCLHKKGTHLELDWGFGQVYTQQKKYCGCGAPVFELVFCNDCNEPYLRGVEKDGKLHQHGNETLDEFSLEIDESENEETDITISSDQETLITSLSVDERAYPMPIDKENILGSPNPVTEINLLHSVEQGCVVCQHQPKKQNFYRRALLGAPFYISNVMPILLDACKESENAAAVPYRGKKLITFSDSRQGTARISIKLQQSSELDSVRSSIYSTSLENVIEVSSELKEENESKRIEKLKHIKQLEALGDSSFQEMIDGFKIEIKALEDALMSEGRVKAVTWFEALQRLQTTNDVSKWVHDYYKKLNPSLFAGEEGLKTLTELLLLREFSRRPKRQNSLETLGLVSVQYLALEKIGAVPDVWKKLNLDLADWQSFLKVVLDFFVRDRVAVDIPQNWVAWFGAKLYPTRLISPLSEDKPGGPVIKWPQYNAKGQQHRLVRLLEIALDLNLGSTRDQDYVNEILKAAWTALTKPYSIGDQGQSIKILTPLADNQTEFQLNRQSMAFAAIDEAWVCPFTNRFIDSVFKSISPYLPKGCIKQDTICKKVKVPKRNISSAEQPSVTAYKKSVDDWLNSDNQILELRAENLWTNVTDRVVGNSGFFASAEHSAQQSAKKLQGYEDAFKANKLNILNCSTTMEMGVDIGGISVVEMNNVPPHPANYLQRAGRAGRRGETQSLAFTICKNNTHEKNVFANPRWPFETNIKAPSIILDSHKIVQRHVNAFLLSIFLKQKIKLEEKDATSLTCHWFFNNQSNGEEPYERFKRWLEAMHAKHSIDASLLFGLKSIINKSSLASISETELVLSCADHILKIGDNWKADYQKVEQEIESISSKEQSDPYAKKLQFDLKNLENEYLLSMLAASTFLPGYGFPTGIVSFDNYTVSNFKRNVGVSSNRREDNNYRIRERPTRNFAVAIREYAPGSEVVLDGLVYKSAGILLNRFDAGSDFNQPQTLETAWRCHKCGAIGHTHVGGDQLVCNQCLNIIKQENKKEYITPDTFTVDFYSDVKNDVSTQTFIPVEKEWVTAGSDIRSLFRPELGDYRVSTEGSIFYHSSGIHGKGFAVCLRCGRSESMDSNGDLPQVFHKPHRKLQGRSSDEFICIGSHENYAVKPNLYLGGTDKTDVFELYLKHPISREYLAHKKDENNLAWTLAVALREALAEIHGVDANEIGYDVKPIDLPDYDQPVAAIVIFDTNGGGSGFSSTAHLHIVELFKKAKSILECRESCESACQSCLLSFETRFDEDKLNRHVALNYINEIETYLITADEHKLFGEGTEYCYEGLYESILSESDVRVSHLCIFTSGKFSDWKIDTTSLKDSLFNLTKTYFNRVSLVLPDEDIQQLSEDNKDDLLMMSRIGVEIGVLKTNMSLPHSGGLIAQVFNSSGKNISFATTVETATIPNEGWWEFDEGVLLRFDGNSSQEIEPFDLSTLKISATQQDVELDIQNEFDGPLNSFGSMFWNEILNQSELLKSKFNGTSKLVSLEYSDCYINSPWVLMLLGEIVDNLRKKLDANWLVDTFSIISSKIYQNSKKTHKGLYQDFSNSEQKKMYLENYFQEMGVEAEVNIQECRDIHHSRFFMLEWSDGERIRVRLDQGVGCWSYKSSKFISSVSSEFDEYQTAILFESIESLDVLNQKGLPTSITIKKL